MLGTDRLERGGMLELPCFLLFACYIVLMQNLAEPLQNRGFLRAVINTAVLARLPGPCCRWQTENEI